MARNSTIDLTLAHNPASLLSIEGSRIVLKMGQEDIRIVCGVENFGFTFVEFLPSNHEIFKVSKPRGSLIIVAVGGSVLRFVICQLLRDSSS